MLEDIGRRVSGAKGREAVGTGDIEAGPVWAGQVRGLIDDVSSDADLARRIVGEADAIVRSRLGGLGTADAVGAA